MSPNHLHPTITQIGSAILDAAEAHEMLGSVIGAIESRPEEPTEAQLKTLLAMAHEGLMVTRQRLKELSYEKGSAFCELINDALSSKDSPAMTIQPTDQDDDSEARVGYLVAAMDLYLSRGDRPAKAFRKATSDYAYEYHHSACFCPGRWCMLRRRVARWFRDRHIGCFRWLADC